MKFSLITAAAASMLSLVSFVVAFDDAHYFTLPAAGSEFYEGDEITFTTNDITNDADEGIIVRLYLAEDDTEVKEINVFTGSDIYRPDDDNDWTFTWVVDVPEGNYYVRAFEQENDGGLLDEEEDEDINRSFDFSIHSNGYVQKRKRAHMKRSRRMSS